MHLTASAIRAIVVVLAAAAFAWPVAEQEIASSQPGKRPGAGRKLLEGAAGSGIRVVGGGTPVVRTFTVVTDRFELTSTDPGDVSFSVHACAPNCELVAAGDDLGNARPPARLRWLPGRKSEGPTGTRTQPILAAPGQEAVVAREHLGIGWELAASASGKTSTWSVAGPPKSVNVSADGSTALFEIADPPAPGAAATRVESWLARRVGDEWLVRRLTEHRRVMCISAEGDHAVVLANGRLHRYDVGNDALGLSLAIEVPHNFLPSYPSMPAPCGVGSDWAAVMTMVQRPRSGILTANEFGRVPAQQWLLERFDTSGTRTHRLTVTASEIAFSPVGDGLCYQTDRGELVAQRWEGQRRRIASRVDDADFLADATLVVLPPGRDPYPLAPRNALS